MANHVVRRTLTVSLGFVAVWIAAVPRLAHAAPLATRSEDPRLSRLVTARALDRPLRAWLPELGSQAGVTIRVARDYEDRAITARLSKVPLGRALDAVVALFGDTMRAQGAKEKSVYVLEPSTARRQRQQQFLATYDRVLYQALLAALDRTIEKGPRLIASDPNETEESRQWMIREMKGRATVCRALGEVALQRLLQGGRVRVRLSELEGKQAEAVRQFVEAQWVNAAGWTREQREGAWLEFSARNRVSTYFAKGTPVRYIYFGLGTGDAVSSRFDFSTDPDEFETKLAEALRVLRRGEAQEPRDRRLEGGEALPKRLSTPSEPRSGQRMPLSRALVALTDAADVNLISDSHCKPLQPMPALSGRTVEEALDAIGELHGCFWRADDGLIAVRSRYWWIDDRHEPPATAVARWDAALADRGVVSLDDACAMSLLTPEQQSRLYYRMREATAAFNPWFRIWGTMSERQRQAALSDDGLALGAISAARRLEMTTREVGHNPYLYRLRLERALMEDRTRIRVKRGPADGSAPILTILMEPPPGPSGRPGQREQIHASLPRRTASSAVESFPPPAP